MTVQSYLDHWPHAASDTFLGTFPTESYISHWANALTDLHEDPNFAITLAHFTESYVDHFPQLPADLNVTV